MEGAILLIVAVGALGAFVTGIILLVLYFRAGRAEHKHRHEPVVYGNLVQCPKCGYMNPLESAACLNPGCRAPLPQPSGYQPSRQHFQQTFMGDQPQPYSGQPYPTQSPSPPPQAYAPRPPVGTPPQPQAPVHPSPAPQPSVIPRADNIPYAWLEGVTGAIQGQRIIVQQNDILVGRSQVCDVQIVDPKVSRKHLRIRYANNAFFMQDQQSSRGTFVNGERVMAQKLTTGDRIKLGDTEVIFHVGQ